VKKHRLLFFLIAVLLTLAACDDGDSESSGIQPPDDPALLQSFHLAALCSGTAIAAAAPYDAAGSDLHPIALYSQNSFDGAVYDFMFPSQTNLPEAVDGAGRPAVWRH
jgi:hypothetical protein